MHTLIFFRCKYFRMGTLWTPASAPDSMKSKASFPPQTFTGIGYIIRIINMKALTDPLILWCSGGVKCAEWKCVEQKSRLSPDGGSVVKAYCPACPPKNLLLLKSVDIAPVYFAVSILPLQFALECWCLIFFMYGVILLFLHVQQGFRHTLLTCVLIVLI